MQFDLPKPVEIPERYIPDSSDEDESPSFEEKLRRKEKADQIKKMIAKQRQLNRRLIFQSTSVQNATFKLEPN